MSFKMDLKQMLTISAILCALAGFYYTTQLRLDRLESEVDSQSCACEADVKFLKKQVQKLNKKMRGLSK
tara:strand:- start:866 stop:1072 length:207 start_codon:yes stop_codon:yes gene_type:complete